MSADDSGDLIEIERNLNAEQYVNILDEVMLPNVRRRYDKEELSSWRTIVQSISLESSKPGTRTIWKSYD